MSPVPHFVDIHCHLVPGIDDGSKSWDESLKMAQMAVADGIQTTVVTPHQLGTFSHNTGDQIRSRTAELQSFLEEYDVPLTVLPGGDVRIEPDMVKKLRSGEVLTLADRGKHVLLELPHELYFPLEGILEKLHAAGMVGILSHPERNQGLLKQPELIPPLVERGCLMQITAGSLLGAFGSGCQEICQWMLRRDLAHFIASDAHGPKSRRPLIGHAYDAAVELVGREIATEICCTNPAKVAEGQRVKIRPPKEEKRRSIFGGLFGRKKAA